MLGKTGSGDGSTASGDAGGRAIVQRFDGLAPFSADVAERDGGLGKSPVCRGIRHFCVQTSDPDAVCPDCIFLHEQQLGAPADLDFLRHCQAIRQYVDQGPSPLFSPYVAAFLVAANGRIREMDERSAEFLRSSGVLGIRHNRLCAPDAAFNEVLLDTVARVAARGVPETLICASTAPTSARYTMMLQPNPPNAKSSLAAPPTVACLIFPLGRRRVASVRQLIAMFKLSAAEARLARALCHGETLEQYAEAQGVKISTLKTQLRAVFTKTETDRQVTLVNLIAGIPPLR